MGWYPGIEISAGGLYAERTKLNVIANNIANVKTTRTPTGEPYRRREVILKSRDSFAELLKGVRHKLPLYVTHPMHSSGIEDRESKIRIREGGVEVEGVHEDTKTPFKVVYDPSHPDADSQGYVKLPNVDITQELTDMIIARRAYEANVAVITVSKSMTRSALEIGK